MKWLTFLSLLYSFWTIAAEPGAKVIPPPDIAVGKDRSITIHWLDGREAKAMFEIRPPATGHIQLKFNENSCFPEAPQPECKIVASSLQLNSNLLWSKHSRTELIGKFVKCKSYSELKEVALDTPVFTEANLLTSKIPEVQNISRSRLVCDQFQWLTGNKTAVAGATIKIPLMTSEFMFPNNETLRSENRSFGGAYNMILKFETPQQAAFDIGHQVFAMGVTTSPFIGSVLHINLQDRNKEDCSIVASSTFFEFAAEAARIEAMQPTEVRPASGLSAYQIKKWVDSLKSSLGPSGDCE